MSVKTLYTCDICKGVQESPEQFWKVGVTAETVSNYGSKYPVKTVEVCRPCLEKLGIHDQRPEPVKVANPAPTVEDLVRQITAMVAEDKL